MTRGAPLRHRRQSTRLADQPINRQECPHPTKSCYRTKAEAKHAITSISGSSVFKRRDDVQAYRCVCGSWHIGHKLGRKQKP